MILLAIDSSLEEEDCGPSAAQTHNSLEMRPSLSKCGQGQAAPALWYRNGCNMALQGGSKLTVRLTLNKELQHSVTGITVRVCTRWHPQE